MTSKIVSISCAACTTEFFDYASGGRKYCSLECSHNGARRAIRPSGHEILGMLETMTWKQIGRNHGVSDNTVRMWAKRGGVMEEYYKRAYS